MDLFLSYLQVIPRRDRFKFVESVENVRPFLDLYELKKKYGEYFLMPENMFMDNLVKTKKALFTNKFIRSQYQDYVMYKTGLDILCFDKERENILYMHRAHIFAPKNRRHFLLSGLKEDIEFAMEQSLSFDPSWKFTLPALYRVILGSYYTFLSCLKGLGRGNNYPALEISNGLTVLKYQGTKEEDEIIDQIYKWRKYNLSDLYTDAYRFSLKNLIPSPYPSSEIMAKMLTSKSSFSARKLLGETKETELGRGLTSPIRWYG